MKSNLVPCNSRALADPRCGSQPPGWAAAQWPGLPSTLHRTDLCEHHQKKDGVGLQRLLWKTLLLAPCSLLERRLWEKTAALSWGHPSSCVGRPRGCKTRLTPTASIGSSATGNPSQAAQLSGFWIPDTQKRGDQQMFTIVSSCQMLGYFVTQRWIIKWVIVSDFGSICQKI